MLWQSLWKKCWYFLFRSSNTVFSDGWRDEADVFGSYLYHRGAAYHHQQTSVSTATLRSVSFEDQTRFYLHDKASRVCCVLQPLSSKRWWCSSPLWDTLVLSALFNQSNPNPSGICCSGCFLHFTSDEFFSNWTLGMRKNVLLAVCVTKWCIKLQTRFKVLGSAATISALFAQNAGRPAQIFLWNAQLSRCWHAVASSLSTIWDCSVEISLQMNFLLISFHVKSEQHSCRTFSGKGQSSGAGGSDCSSVRTGL